MIGSQKYDIVVTIAGTYLLNLFSSNSLAFIQSSESQLWNWIILLTTLVCYHKPLLKTFKKSPCPSKLSLHEKRAADSSNLEINGVVTKNRCKDVQTEDDIKSEEVR